MKNQEHLNSSVQKEQIGMDNNQLKIIESRAFKIIIVNISDRVKMIAKNGRNGKFQPIEGKLLIVRKIALAETVIIPLSLASALHPRVELTVNQIRLYFNKKI